MNWEAEVGHIIAAQVQKIITEQNYSWERILRLHIRPKPKWCPQLLWERILKIVLIQSVETK